MVLDLHGVPGVPEDHGGGLNAVPGPWFKVPSPGSRVQRLGTRDQGLGTFYYLIGFHSQLVPGSSLMKGGWPCPRGKIFPAWAIGPNRRDAPRQAPYFLSRRRPKVSKKRLPLRGACARAVPVPRLSLVDNQPRRGSVITIASPIAGRWPHALLQLCSARSEALVVEKHLKPSSAGVRSAKQHAGTITTLRRWSKRRRAGPISPGGVPILRSLRPHAGGSPGSFGYFSEPNQISNASGGTRPADLESPLAPLSQGGNLFG